MTDFKKESKELYQPKTAPALVNVLEMTFIMVDGRGDPNTSAEYAAAVEALYGLSYAIKMSSKAVLEYVVPPLEGLWEVDDGSVFKGGGAAITDKSAFRWTVMIRQPDFVTNTVFETARTALAKKKPAANLSHARLETFAEGLCVQAMHIGPYDAELTTVAALDQFAIDSGYVIDLSGPRRHHEIYLSDPRKTLPEKLKTVIRHPVKRRAQ
jgi:hypothetical protein